MTREEKLKKIRKVIGTTEYSIGDSEKQKIGDILQYLSDTMPRKYSAECNIYVDRVMKLIGVWEYKIANIECQSDECIDYVYSLIPTQ